MGAGCWKGAAAPEKNDEAPQGWTEGFDSKAVHSRSTASRPVSQARPEPRAQDSQALLKTAADVAWTQGELETGKELPKISAETTPGLKKGSYRREPKVNKSRSQEAEREGVGGLVEPAWPKGRKTPVTTLSGMNVEDSSALSGTMLEETPPQANPNPEWGGPIEPVWPKGRAVPMSIEEIEGADPRQGGPSMSDMEVVDGGPGDSKIVKRLALPESPSKAKMGRSLSVRSAKALSRLEEIELQVASLETQVGDIAAALTGRSEISHEEVGHCKTQLALLEAQAHKLETNGVDGVYTGELESGKADAKAAKKNQLERLEVLFGRIEDIFQVIKQRQEQKT